VARAALSGHRTGSITPSAESGLLIRSSVSRVSDHSSAICRLSRPPLVDERKRSPRISRPRGTRQRRPPVASPLWRRSTTATLTSALAISASVNAVPADRRRRRDSRLPKPGSPWKPSSADRGRGQQRANFVDPRGRCTARQKPVVIGNTVPLILSAGTRERSIWADNARSHSG
jgi:hypothetical protein